MFCTGCKKKHKSRNWKYIKGSWYCTKWHKPSRMGEFMPEHVKDERNEYFNSIVQPFRGDDLSKEYIDAHGTEGINVTPEEVSKAENVWKDLEGHSTRKYSK